MALKIANFTLSGSAESLSANVHIPIKWLRIHNTTSNADIKVGDKTLTASIFGFLVEDGPTAEKDIGPFGGGESPFNLGDVWVLGTGSQVIHLTYVTL